MLSFLPRFIFPKITDIAPEFLAERGIRLLLMDFDNTMLPYTTDVPEQELGRPGHRGRVAAGADDPLGEGSESAEPQRTGGDIAEFRVRRVSLLHEGE